MIDQTAICPTQIHTFLAAKGGQGTTVVAATVALLHAHRGTRTLLIDAAPDTTALRGRAPCGDQGAKSAARCRLP